MTITIDAIGALGVKNYTCTLENYIDSVQIEKVRSFIDTVDSSDDYSYQFSVNDNQTTANLFFDNYDSLANHISKTFYIKQKCACAS
jgi:hypothetical protein